MLKESELKYSLLTDLMAFAESDQEYSEAEKQQVKSVADYLGIAPEQYSTINQFVHKAATSGVDATAATEPQGLLESLGMQNQFQRAGMNFGNISKGLLGMLLPLILGKMMNGGRGGGGGMLGGGSRGGGGLGDLLGGLLGGGGGGMLGGGSRGGGLGSLINILSGGKGMGNIGGMLGRMFGR